MDFRKLLGREGEARAAKYLRYKGYEIIGLNYTCRMGEIDVIAQKDGYIVFVEVKLRKDASFAEAREFVTNAKQSRVRRAALQWLEINDPDLQPRFDVIEVYTESNTINHIENAFE